MLRCHGHDCTLWILSNPILLVYSLERKAGREIWLQPCIIIWPNCVGLDKSHDSYSPTAEERIDENYSILLI